MKAHPIMRVVEVEQYLGDPQPIMQLASHVTGVRVTPAYRDQTLILDEPSKQSRLIHLNDWLMLDTGNHLHVVAADAFERGYKVQS